MERIFYVFLCVATFFSGELCAQKTHIKAQQHAYSLELLHAPSNVVAKEIVEYFNIVDPAAKIDFDRSCKQLIIEQDHRSSITDIVEILEARGLVIQKVNMHPVPKGKHSWNVTVTKHATK